MKKEREIKERQEWSILGKDDELNYVIVSNLIEKGKYAVVYNTYSGRKSTIRVDRFNKDWRIDYMYMIPKRDYASFLKRKAEGALDW